MTYIIAEAGINHNGSLSLAKKLAKKSFESGADAVKFQTFWDMGRLSKYELTKEETIKLKEYCKKIGIDFMSTPHTIDAIHFIDKLVDIHKIASPFLTNETFLNNFKNAKKTILLSTGSIINISGMATIPEIKRALKILEKNNVVLLHCVSRYPCHNPYYDRILELKDIFGIDVGLSDHSKNINIPNVPYLEKHIMLHNVDSIDKNVSLYPEEFTRMTNNIRGEQ